MLRRDESHCDEASPRWVGAAATTNDGLTRERDAFGPNRPKIGALSGRSLVLSIPGPSPHSVGRLSRPAHYQTTSRPDDLNVNVASYPAIVSRAER